MEERNDWMSNLSCLYRSLERRFLRDLYFDRSPDKDFLVSRKIKKKDLFDHGKMIVTFFTGVCEENCNSLERKVVS